MATPHHTEQRQSSLIIPNIQNMDELFRCYICMEKLSDTRLCPKCSKMCCYPCIRRWLIEQKPSCPHCRSSLLLHELVRCRWVDDLLALFKSSEEALIGLDKDKCKIHNDQLSVYCVTCTLCVCHQCALWGGDHNGHHFHPVAEVYEIRKKCIHSEICNLKKKLAEILDCVSEIDKHLSNCDHERSFQIKLIEKVVSDITTRLDNQIWSHIAKLRSKQTVLQNEGDIIEKKIEEVLHKIDSNVKSELINESSTILTELTNMSSQLTKPHVAQLTTVAQKLEITSELIPRYTDLEYTINNFSSCRETGAPIYSPQLSLHGQNWRLKVYPDGNGVFRGEFLSVFLELASGYQGVSKYEYKVAMLHVSHHTEKAVFREFSSDFEVGECWGYNRFYRLEHLMNRGFIDKDQDSLCLKFSVRCPTYYKECKLQDLHIYHLKNELNFVQNRLKEVDATRKYADETTPNSDDVIENSERNGIQTGQLNTTNDEDIEMHSITPAQSNPSTTITSDYLDASVICLDDTVNTSNTMTIIEDVEANQSLKINDDIASIHTPPLSNSSIASDGSQTSLNQIVLATTSDEEEMPNGHAKCKPLYTSDYFIGDSQDEETDLSLRSLTGSLGDEENDDTNIRSGANNNTKQKPLIKLDETLTSSQRNTSIDTIGSAFTTPISEALSYIEAVPDSTLPAIDKPNMIDIDRISNDSYKINSSKTYNGFRNRERDIAESVNQFGSKSSTNLVTKLDTSKNTLTTTLSLSLDLLCKNTKTSVNFLNTHHKPQNDSGSITFSHDRQALEEQKRLLDLQILQLTEEMNLMETGKATSINNNNNNDNNNNNNNNNSDDNNNATIMTASNDGDDVGGSCDNANANITQS